jgi:hypothetical protein
MGLFALLRRCHSYGKSVAMIFSWYVREFDPAGLKQEIKSDR